MEMAVLLLNKLMIERKNPFILIISLLLITGFLLTSLASYFTSRSSLRSQIIKDSLPLTSDNIYSEIQRDLLRPIFISSLMATDTFLRDWVIQGEEDENQLTRYLKEVKVRYNAFTTFFVSERTRIYYHADGIFKQVAPNDERDKWYFRVRQMQSDYEINIDPDAINQDTLTIFINYRVYDYDGDFIGATGVGLAVNSTQMLIENYQKNYGRKVFLVDKRGNIKLHSSTFPKEVESIFDLEGLSSFTKEILSSDSNSFQYHNKGQTVHLNTRYIPEFQWYLVVEQAEEKVVRNILTTLLINFLICSIITIIILLLVNVVISAYQNRLEKMATIDKLTGAYNRQAFDITFSQILKDTQRNKLSFALILFDIDHFKQVNDKFGHLAGDAVIKNVAKVAQTSIRSSDVLCRWGGEEFIIILKECTLDSAFNLAEKIRVLIKETPTLYKSKEITVTASFGVAHYDVRENEGNILSRVDKALYSAKQKGRNQSKKAV